MNVEAIMSKPVITVRSTQSMLEASRTMKDHAVKHLVVLDEHDRLVGVVTDRDLKRASASDATTLEIHELLYLLDKITVSDVMTKHPVAIGPSASAAEAAKLMVDKGIGCLPVSDSDKVVGIVTRDDLLRLLAGQA